MNFLFVSFPPGATQVYQHQWRPLRSLPLSFWLIRILTMRPSGWRPWRPADVITTTTCRFCINKRLAKAARFVSLTAKVTTWRKRSIPLDTWRPAKGGRWPIDFLSPNVKYTRMKCQPIKLIKINANNRICLVAGENVVPKSTGQMATNSQGNCFILIHMFY